MNKFKAFYKKYQMIIFTALAALICAGAALIGYHYLNRMEKALWNQLIVDLTEVTYQGGRAFETYALQEQETVGKLAEGMSEFNSDDEDATTLLKTYALGDGLFSLIIYDENGGKLYISGQDDIEETALSKAETDEIIKDYGERGITTFLNFYTGQLTLGHYQKFTFKDGKTAVIRKGQLMDYLRQEFSLSFYNQTGFSYISDEGGNILIRPTHKNSNRTAVSLSDLLLQSGGTDAEIEQLSSLMKDGMRGALRLSSENRVLAFVPLESVGCYLISIVPNSSIMKHVDEILQTSQTLTVIVITVFIFVIIFALATYFYRRKIMAGEREVKYREQLFGLLASNTDDIYMLMSLKDFSLEYVSPNSQRVLGVTQKDIQNSILEIINQGYEDEYSKSLKSLAALPEGESETNKHDRVHRETGETKHFVDTIFRTTIDSVNKLIIILSDRTAEIQSETALKDAMESALAANKAKSVFLSNMSHDIRTPMNAILGFTELMKRDAENSEKVLEYTDKISSSGQHLLGLINDILDMSKIENGKFVLNIQKFSFTQFIDELDNMMRPQAEKRKQSFEITNNAAQENLLGDKLRINQILINILSNAIKYTPEGGKISMDISELPKINSNFAHLKFTVTDNGIGMSEEYRENLFQPFTREISSTVNAIQGTGLGMAITKNLVDLMSGTITVKSKQGVGSTFVVELELRIDDSDRDTPATPKAQADKVPEKALEGRRFLAAEDNELNSEILVELLDIRSSTCEIAGNGKIALEMFEKSPEGYYDGILMDIQMPVMNGYEAAKAIRSLSRPDAQTIPIIAMTANAFSEDINNSFEAGMDAHIAKPVDMDKLEEVFREILNNR